MSHFSVIVFGDDVDGALAPFHEFECTGIDDEFVQTIDITEEARSEWDGKGDFAEWVADYYGYTQDSEFGFVTPDGSVFRRTNPNSKWDWYVIGGRWEGFIVGETIGEVDWEMMRAEGRKRGEQIFNAIEGIPLDWKPWSEVGDREVYWEQENLKLAKGKIDEVFFNFDDLLIGREAYITQCENEAISPFAFIDEDFNWHQQGEMGWWGMSSDEMTKTDWADFFWKKVQSLPADTKITVVDCHI